MKKFAAGLLIGVLITHHVNKVVYWRYVAMAEGRAESLMDAIKDLTEYGTFSPDDRDRILDGLVFRSAMMVEGMHEVLSAVEENPNG